MMHPKSPCAKGCPERSETCYISYPRQKTYEKEMEAYRAYKARIYRGNCDYADHVRRINERRRRHSWNKKARKDEYL